MDRQTTTASTASIETIIETCETLFLPGDVVEVRIMDVPRRGTVAGWFDDFEQLAKAVQFAVGKHNVYVTLNPCKPGILARAANRLKDYQKQTTSDEDILERRWLLVDFDPIRPSGVSASDEEHRAALDSAKQAYRLLKTEMQWSGVLAADSGNGAHLLVPIDLPNDEIATGLCQNVLKGLAHRFNNEFVSVDVKTFNAARICTLYGTMKVKGDNTADRPHRMARLWKEGRK